MPRKRKWYKFYTMALSYEYRVTYSRSPYCHFIKLLQGIWSWSPWQNPKYNRRGPWPPARLVQLKTNLISFLLAPDWYLSPTNTILKVPSRSQIFSVLQYWLILKYYSTGTIAPLRQWWHCPKMHPPFKQLSCIARNPCLLKFGDFMMFWAQLQSTEHHLYFD